MKKKTLLILAVLITALACLFTSCSASVEPPKAEDVAYVTFGNGSSRTLTTEYGIIPYSDLYWDYTSVKKDSYGTTGVADHAPVSKDSAGNQIKGLSGTVGPFSQGAWQFTLSAYKADKTTGTKTTTLVYEGTSDIVVLKGGETKAVPVSVSLMGDAGTLDFSGAYFKWNVSGTGDVYLRINIVGTADDSTAVDKTTIQRVTSSNGYMMPQYLDFGFGEGVFPAGYYTCTVQAYVLEDFEENNSSNALKSDSTYKASQSFGLRIYGNAVTKVKDYIEEGIFGNVIFDVAKQDMKVFVPNDNGSATINNISVTPSGETGKTTSVTFSAGALSDVDDATLQLDVKVTPVESSNEKFNINGVDSDNKSAFAGIDVTLWATDTAGTANAVSSFANGTYATVTTYIAKGLENVSVKYKGTDKDQPIATDSTEEGVDKTFAAVLDTDEGNALGYNPSTGLLRFKTNHFSEYYVLADCVALNSKRNIGYSSLEDAVSGAETNDTIKMMANYVIPQSIGTIEISADKNLILDLNGRTLSSSIRVDNAAKHYYAIDNYGSLTIEDSSPKQTGTIRARGIENLGNGVLVINSGKLYSIDSNGGASIWNEAFLVVNGGSFYTEHVGSASDGTGIGCLNNQGSALITGGYFKDVNKRTYAIISTGEIVINPGEGKEVTVIGAHGGLAIDSGTAVIYGGNYSSDEFYGLYVSNDGKGLDPEIATVTVHDGVFNGLAYSVWIGSDYNNPVNSTIEILGGTFVKPLNAQGCTREGAIIIKGGIYSSNPSDYVASGYGCRSTADGKYEVVSMRDAGYVNNPLPTGPTKNGDVWTVTPDNAQFTLDGAYGSIDGKTIILSEGEYPQLEFGRATKYSGSNTGYFIGGINEENEKTFDEFYVIKNSGTWSASAYYMRNISNVTLKAVEGADVTIHGLFASSGHVYGEVYDYVLDKAYTSGSAYYLSQNISNITFENIQFDSKVEFSTSSADTIIDGVKFKNCSFTTGGTASTNGQGLRYYNEANNGKVKNLTVEGCSFNNCYQGIYTQKINGITVTGSSFNATGHNAIAVQSGSEAVNHKAVIITGNTFSNIGDRIIRFGDVASDTQITIKNNTATDSGDSSGQIMKAQSLEKGVTYDISGNNWGEGKTAANPELADR